MRVGAIKSFKIVASCSRADYERAKYLAGRLEMSVSEMLRYYVREAFNALGARDPTITNIQGQLFPDVRRDGAPRVSVPIPGQLPRMEATPEEGKVSDLAP